MKDMKNKPSYIRGFSLIEIMIVIVMLAILVGIAIPNYQHYIRKSQFTQAQQEVYKLAEQLERYKTRNFTYKSFNADYLYSSLDGNNAEIVFDTSTQTLNLSFNQGQVKYVIKIIDEDTLKPLNNDEAKGVNWRIEARSTDPRNKSLLLSNDGTTCQKTAVPSQGEICSE